MPTRTQLVIEGNLITKTEVEEGESGGRRFRRETEVATVKLPELLDALVEARGDEWFVPRLSNGQIIAHKTAGSREVAVIEFAPAVRRIIESVDQSDPRARQLAFPWVYLVASFAGGGLSYIKPFFRNEPAGEVSAELNWSNFPNVYSDGRLCTGSVSGCDTSWPLARRSDWLAQMFWDSQFNRDLLSEHWDPSRKLATHPQSFAEWEQMSASDPSFVLGIGWRPAGTTIRQELDQGVR